MLLIINCLIVTNRKLYKYNISRKNMDLERIGLGNWAYCLAQARDANKRVSTGRELIKDRLERGVNDQTHFGRGGAWATEDSNVVDGVILLARAKFNPLIPYAEQAVDAQRTGEFHLTDEIVRGKKPFAQVLQNIAEEDARKPLEKRRVLNIGQAKTHQVPTDSFVDDPTIRWMAQDPKLAKRYGFFLRNELPENLRLQEVTVYLPVIAEKNYSRGHWLDGLGRCGRSGFGCDSRGLDGGDGSVFGVSMSAEGTPRRVSEPKVRSYTPREARRYLNVSKKSVCFS